MPDPETWYQNKNAKEILLNLYLEGCNYEIRVRERFLTTKLAKSKRKDIDIFSIGLEIKKDLIEKWIVLVRHCNYHSKNKREFHTHNDYKLNSLGNEIKIINKLPKKKIPASQMRWAFKDIRTNYIKYLKEFMKMEEKND